MRIQSVVVTQSHAGSTHPRRRGVTSPRHCIQYKKKAAMQQQQDRQYNNRRQKSRQERDSFPTVWQSSVFNNVLSWSAMFIAFDNLV